MIVEVLVKVEVAQAMERTSSVAVANKINETIYDRFNWNKCRRLAQTKFFDSDVNGSPTSVRKRRSGCHKCNSGIPLGFKMTL